MASLSAAQKILTITREYTFAIGFITFGFGFIGNLLNILVFLSHRAFRRNKCVFYLITESFVDIVAVVFNVALQILTMLYGSDLSPYVSVWCKFRAMILQTLALSVLCTTCFAAIDQYHSTSYSPYLRRMSSLTMARSFVVVLLCFSIGHSIMFGAFFDSKPPVDCVASNPIVIKYYSYFFYPILGGLLPISVSGLASILAYQNVRRITRRQLPIVRRRLDHQLTTFVFIRVIFLVICLAPLVTHRIYALNVVIRPTESLRVAIERLVFAFVLSMYGFIYAVTSRFSIHPSYQKSTLFQVNFYIFFASSSRYRRQVRHILLKKYWRLWKQWFRSVPNRVEPSPGPTVSENELE